MKNEKELDARLPKKEDASSILRKYMEKKYEKSPLWKNFENYEENLKCMQDVTDRIFECMKGYGVSFKPEITDKKGEFSEEKLSAFVEKLLTIWADKQREGTFPDPSTEESLAEPYIRKRQELYSCCLYILMRCCLEKGAYALVAGGKLEEQTNFSFLLEEAKLMMRSWCVMDYPEPEGKKNELFYGYDDVFGLHLYAFLLGGYHGWDVGFDAKGKCLPESRPAYLTDEGNVKRNQLKSIYHGCMPSLLVQQAKADEADVAEDDLKDEDSPDIADADYDNESNHESEDIKNDEYMEYDPEYDEAYEDYLSMNGWNKEEFNEWQAEKDAEEECKELLYNFFIGENEYITKCKRFVELFEQAETEVLRDFCKDLEEIVILYLIDRDIPPMMDTSKAMNVYGSIYDNALQQAKRYERGIQWKTTR